MRFNNPFLISGFGGATYFCDRTKELGALEEHMNNGRNVVLYAWRRLGKTSLIQYFLKRNEKKGGDSLYIDLLATTRFEEALNHISQAVFEKYGKTENRSFFKLLSKLGASVSFDPVSGMPEMQISVQKGQNEAKSLHTIGEFLRSRKSNIVIALDEFQQIEHYEEKGSEALFRAWAQQFPDIRFIFSGSHRSMMLNMFSEKNRPFYQSSQLMPLDPIPLSEYRKFIHHHFTASGKKISEKTIDTIYDWSREQTYTIQLLCNKLYAAHRVVKKSHLPQVFDEILEQQTPIFANYQKMLSKIQWKLLRAIAREEPLKNPMSQAFLQQHKLGAASTINSALKALMKKEIVIKDENVYLIHDVLFARWLQSL